MSEILKMYLFPTIMSTLIAIYIQSEILKIKINIKSFRFYLGLLIGIALLILNRVYVHDYFRFIFSFIIVLTSSSIIFKRKIYELYGVVFIQQSLMFISELIFLAVLNVLNQSLLSLSYTNYLMSLLINAEVCILALLIYGNRKVAYLCGKFVTYVNEVAGLRKYVVVLIFITTLNVLLMFMYFKDDIIIVVNSIFIAIYGIIVYFLIAEANEKLRIQQQNEGLLKTLNEYEKILDQQRVDNHENKNQLLILKTMANKNNKKLLNYLDEMIKEKQEDDEVLYASAKRIPQGGLQGLIYQKMLHMKDENISVMLNVDRQVKKTLFANIKPKINFESCRAVGVIIDNAIEETIKLKEKEIFIDIYVDQGYLCVAIVNKCSTIPDLSKIDEIGYTTKETGHGYGLALLKEICNSHKEIINERKVQGMTFTQIIKIKM